MPSDHLFLGCLFSVLPSLHSLNALCNTESNNSYQQSNVSSFIGFMSVCVLASGGWAMQGRQKSWWCLFVSCSRHGWSRFCCWLNPSTDERAFVC